MRGERRRFAELVGATALAVGQPLLDVFGRSTETFVFRGVDGRGYVLFALAVVLLPPIVLWLSGWLIGRLRPRSRERVHVITVAALVGMAGLIAVRWITALRGGPALAIAVSVAVAVVFVGSRHPSTLRFFAYLAVLPAVAVISFVATAPASALLGGGGIDRAATSTAPASDRPVVMLLLDEFPTVALLDADGDIDPVRYPNFARLGREGAWYRNYTTLSASTIRAVPSILTGTVPRRDQQPVWNDRPDNLFTLLADSHELRVRETVTQLCPPSTCGGETELSRTSTASASGLPGLAGDSVDVLRQLLDPRSEPGVAIDAFTEDLVSLDPVASTTETDDRATVQPARFAGFVDDLVEADEAVLHFLHLILPHGPWRFTQDGTEYASPRADPPGQVGGIWTDDWPAALTEFRLELQARYTDLLLGQVIDRLETTGLWDRATFVVVADHGGSFIAGERGRALTDANAFEVMWAPLFVRSPGLRPGPADVNAQGVDVLPTIAELSGVPMPFETDGQALVRTEAAALVPASGVGGDTGRKQYARFTNPFQPEEDAVLDIDSDRELARVLAAGRAVTAAEAADPIGTFQRGTPHGDLYGRPIDSLDVGAEVDATLELDQRAPLVDGAGAAPVPAYVSGWTDDDLGDLGGDPWFVIALDGAVAALSPVFPSADHDRSVATMIDPARVDPPGNELTAYVVTRPGGPLRPVAVS